MAINHSAFNIPNVPAATLIEGGRMLFLSGHVPLRPDGSLVGPLLEEQLEQVFQNIGMTLKAAEGDFSNVARFTIYVRDLTPPDLPVIRAARDRHINIDHPPASTLVGVAGLYDPAIRVEIDAVAVF